MTGRDSVPDWVLTEVGRLHLHALALERHAAIVTAERDDLLDQLHPAPAPPDLAADPAEEPA